MAKQVPLPTQPGLAWFHTSGKNLRVKGFTRNKHALLPAWNTPHCSAKLHPVKVCMHHGWICRACPREAAHRRLFSLLVGVSTTPESPTAGLGLWITAGLLQTSELATSARQTVDCSQRPKRGRARATCLRMYPRSTPLCSVSGGGCHWTMMD